VKRHHGSSSFSALSWLLFTIFTHSSNRCCLFLGCSLLRCWHCCYMLIYCSNSRFSVETSTVFVISKFFLGITNRARTTTSYLDCACFSVHMFSTNISLDTFTVVCSKSSCFAARESKSLLYSFFFVAFILAFFLILILCFFFRFLLNLFNNMRVVEFIDILDHCTGRLSGQTTLM
jgi:hypothetical protein